MAEKLGDIESRIAALERIVFGSSSDNRESESAEAITDNLASLDNKLNKIVSNNDKIKEAMQQVINLSQYLDPAFLENITAPLEAKYHVLELTGPTQENRAKLLEQLKSLEWVLDSEHIKNAPNFNGQLAQLSIHLAQQAEAVHNHTAEVSDLLNTYSRVVMALSKQAIFWDQSLTALEAAKGTKQ